MMTINDYPEYLAIGYLYNQGINADSDVKKIEYPKPDGVLLELIQRPTLKKS